MLFTTAVFACLFLPVALGGFFVIGRHSHSGAATWLFAISLFFYGYWMPEFTLLLVGSICGNFMVGTRIGKAEKGAAKRWLVTGLAVNLALLAYFKYVNFFIDNLDAALGFKWNIGRVLLPLGISFFTFTQIAFLADAYQKGVREYKFTHYGLFVTYFPHLIAGPVLHHAQMMPQFANPATYRWNPANVAGGLAIFAIGLFKKVILADGVSPFADAIFHAADSGIAPTFHEAWLGALAYTFQIYFDFSGYSDMAVGISWMFNIRLPFNFDSPYRALNISDFWRRWHISLSNFLRDYLYIALGGNRHGHVRRYVNLAVTMVLGGLWHGASWTFVFWGTLHGVYLVIHHGFRAILNKQTSSQSGDNRLFKFLGWLLTIVSVIVAWVFFRAETFAGAKRILLGMITPNGEDVINQILWNAGLQVSSGAMWCAAAGLLAFLAPNSNRIGLYILELSRQNSRIVTSVAGTSVAAAFILILINTARDSVSAFIYFNF